MKNMKLIGEMVKEVSIELARNTRVATKTIAAKMAHALQPVIEEETGVIVNQEHEDFMAGLLVEQIEKAYVTYEHKDRISSKRYAEGIATAKEIASAVYKDGIVDGATALDRGITYSLDTMDRMMMDSFRDRRNETANQVANIVRSINDPELYYYIEAMLPAAIENVVVAAKAHLASQNEVVDSINDIAESITNSILKDERTIRLLAE